MKERPIPFSGPMVRAILDGRKTMTRRIVKHIGNAMHYGKLLCDWPLSEPPFHRIEDNAWFWKLQTAVDDAKMFYLKCPYGQPGDRLWVRETWANGQAGIGLVLYRADSENQRHKIINNKWKSPYRMPRWASRITLEILSIKVERLQEISEEDCLKEGVDAKPQSNIPWFRDLWESINGKGSWDLNPWVWVIEFKRIMEGK